MNLKDLRLRHRLGALGRALVLNMTFIVHLCKAINDLGTLYVRRLSNFKHFVGPAFLFALFHRCWLDGLLLHLLRALTDLHLPVLLAGDRIARN